MGLNKSVIEHAALIIVLTVVSAAQANHEVNSSGKGEVKESCAIINDFRPSADCQKVCRSIVDGILFGDRLKIVKALETHSSFFDELVKARANCLDRPEKPRWPNWLWRHLETRASSRESAVNSRSVMRWCKRKRLRS